MAQDIGERKGNSMDNKIDKYGYGPDGYKDAPEGEGMSDNAVIVEDFLPPPEVIAKAIEKKKLTIQISKMAAEFFQEEAKKHGVPYQAMIRKVLDEYVRRMKS